MAENNSTIFQRLGAAFRSNNRQSVSQEIVSAPRNGYTSNDILYSTNDKNDYERKLHSYKQQKYLSYQWKKAVADNSMESLASYNAIKLMYRDADLMCNDTEIGTACDIISEESCLGGGTKIKLLNGETHTIEDMYKNGMEDFWCYSVDEKGICRPTHIDKVINKGVKDIYEIYLDDETIIRCTPDHKWMLSSCEWKETKDLLSGDSLMSIYGYINMYGYELIKSTAEKRYSLTHRIVAPVAHKDILMNLLEENSQEDLVIHHNSFNKLNNDPSFLTYMTREAHARLHNDINVKKWEDVEFSQKMKKIFSETAKKTWKEQGESLRKKMSEAHAKFKLSNKYAKWLKCTRHFGIENGMYGIHRFGGDNPNFNKKRFHFEDIDEEKYTAIAVANLENYREVLEKEFNLTKDAVCKYNAYLCKKYNIKSILELKYACDGPYNAIIESINNGAQTSSEITKRTGYNYHLIKEILKRRGKTLNNLIIYNPWNKISKNEYISFLMNVPAGSSIINELSNKFNLSRKKVISLNEILKKEYDVDRITDLKYRITCSNHRVVKIVKLNKKEHVYDLLNSTTNNCFAITCNHGMIISHNCPITSKGKMLNIYSKSPRVKSILEDLFVNRLHIYTELPLIAHDLIKYGNVFQLLNIDKDNGIMGWVMLPVYEVDRIENGYSATYVQGMMTQTSKIEEDEVKFVRRGTAGEEVFQNWQIAHFRLLNDSIFLPYGTSMLHKARRAWRMWSMMEDAMLIWRLDKAVERRVFKVYVGGIDDKDVPSYIDDVANEFKRVQMVDPKTGQLDLRKNFLDVSKDFFIPVRREDAPSPIETLQGANSQVQMEDIEYMQNKLFAALRVPKTFLNFQEAQGKGQNLALMDIRFSRMINRAQQFLLMELNKVAMIHLYTLNLSDEIGNFTLSLNNPSSQIESQEIDDLTKRLNAMQVAVTDPGIGIPMMSLHRALRDIMKMPDSEIKDMLNEIRLEKAMGAELAATANIIKKTGMFDTVDRIYGDYDAMNGAQQMPQQQGQDNGIVGGAMGGGAMGGGAPMGGMGDMGDDIGMDMGEPGTEDGTDLGGENGETDMTNAPSVDDGTPLSENKNKPIIKENKTRKNISKSFISQYFDMLQEGINEEKELTEEVFDWDLKNSTMQEQMNKIFNKIDKLVDEESVEREKILTEAAEAAEAINKLSGETNSGVEENAAEIELDKALDDVSDEEFED